MNLRELTRPLAVPRLPARTPALGAALLALGFAWGCGSPAAERDAAEVEEIRIEGAVSEDHALPRAELERARATATALGQDLGGLLLTTLERAGPEAALEVCSEVAQERTAAHAREGVTVRRVSQRVRNPLNTPDDAERRELERLQVLAAEGRLPAEIVRVVRGEDGRRLHLIRPIVLQAPCLACHGEPEAMAPGVRALIAERYPEDRAVGYEAGELRGAISVKVPLTGGS